LVDGVVKLWQRVGEDDITAPQCVHRRPDHAQRDRAHLLKVLEHLWVLGETVD
jgi:hypothetical protein